jgi:hypothetical protein
MALKLIALTCLFQGRQDDYLKWMEEAVRLEPDGRTILQFVQGEILRRTQSNHR